MNPAYRNLLESPASAAVFIKYSINNPEGNNGSGIWSRILQL